MKNESNIQQIPCLILESLWNIIYIRNHLTRHGAVKDEINKTGFKRENLKNYTLCKELKRIILSGYCVYFLTVVRWEYLLVLNTCHVTVTIFSFLTYVIS